MFMGLETARKCSTTKNLAMSLLEEAQAKEGGGRLLIDLAYPAITSIQTPFATSFKSVLGRHFGKLRFAAATQTGSFLQPEPKQSFGEVRSQTEFGNEAIESIIEVLLPRIVVFPKSGVLILALRGLN